MCYVYVIHVSSIISYYLLSSSALSADPLQFTIVRSGPPQCLLARLLCRGVLVGSLLVGEGRLGPKNRGLFFTGHICLFVLMGHICS